jgi:hypothetical protein
MCFKTKWLNRYTNESKEEGDGKPLYINAVDEPDRHLVGINHPNFMEYTAPHRPLSVIPAEHLLFTTDALGVQLMCTDGRQTMGCLLGGPPRTAIVVIGREGCRCATRSLYPPAVAFG